MRGSMGDRFGTLVRRLDGKIGDRFERSEMKPLHRAVTAERPRGHHLADRVVLPDHRDVLGLNLTARLDQHDGVLDHILQLAHVAAPRSHPQRAHGRFREPWERRSRVAVATPIIRQKVVG